MVMMWLSPTNDRWIQLDQRNTANAPPAENQTGEGEQGEIEEPPPEEGWVIFLFRTILLAVTLSTIADN